MENLSILPQAYCKIIPQYEFVDVWALSWPITRFSRAVCNTKQFTSQSLIYSTFFHSLTLALSSTVVGVANPTVVRWSDYWPNNLPYSHYRTSTTLRRAFQRLIIRNQENHHYSLRKRKKKNMEKSIPATSSIPTRAPSRLKYGSLKVVYNNQHIKRQERERQNNENIMESQTQKEK